MPLLPPSVRSLSVHNRALPWLLPLPPCRVTAVLLHPQKQPEAGSAGQRSEPLEIGSGPTPDAAWHAAAERQLVSTATLLLLVC